MAYSAKSPPDALMIRDDHCRSDRLLADDQDLFRHGLRQICEIKGGFDL